MAGVVEVSLLLRQQNILLHLVREVRGGGYFDGCKLQVLQTFDLLCSGLAKKKSKKMAIDSVPIGDLTAFIHCIIFLAGASMADAASNHFEVDPEVRKERLLPCFCWSWKGCDLVARASVHLFTFYVGLRRISSLGPLSHSLLVMMFRFVWLKVIFLLHSFKEASIGAYIPIIPPVFGLSITDLSGVRNEVLVVTITA